MHQGFRLWPVLPVAYNAIGQSAEQYVIRVYRFRMSRPGNVRDIKNGANDAPRFAFKLYFSNKFLDLFLVEHLSTATCFDKL